MSELWFNLIIFAAGGLAAALAGLLLLRGSWRQRTSRRDALQETLQEMGKLLTGYDSLDEILIQVLELLDEVVEFDSCSLILLDESQGVYLAASRGIDRVERLEQGLAEHAEKFLPAHWEGDKTIYLFDTQESEDWFFLPETAYIRSWIGAALMVKDRYIGLLNVDHREVDAYTREDVRMVKAFADQAAVAIENSRLFEESRRSTRRLQLLFDLNKALSSTLNAEIIIERSLDLALEAIGGEKADFYRMDPGTGLIRLEQSSGRERSEIEKLNYYFSYGENTSDVGWVLEHDQPLSIPDVQQDKLWVEMPMLDANIHSLLSVPVRINHEPAGVISVLHSQQAAFSAEQAVLLEAMSRQIGLALNNAQRYLEVAFLLTSLKAKQELQDKMLAHLPTGILLLDANFKLLSGNRYGCQVLEDLRTTGSEEPITQIGDKKIREIIRFQHDPFPVEVRQEEPEKKFFEVKMRRVETIEGKYWLLVITDVTQERELKERLDVQERMATLGQFAAGIAHDFNNIMSAILVYSDVIKKDQQISDKNLGRIQVIQEQSQRASDLIAQILDFSRHSVIEKEPFDLVPFLAQTRDILERMLPETIPVQLKISPEIRTLPVLGDPARMQQMLMNLAVNARDAMPGGGDLEISLSDLEVSSFEMAPYPEMVPGKWICLQVADQGEGISPQDQKRIFDPFFTTKKSKKGTGLGLSQVYGIVKQHQGYIDLTSEPGVGTVFTIYLPPFEWEFHPAEEQDQGVLIDGEGQVVLIVEDDDSLREALWSMLEEHNFQVISAGNGRKGFDVIQQIGERLALVMTDVVMPEMGGLELYRRCRALYPEKRFLFITGHPAQLDDQEISRDTLARTLVKPFTMAEILGVIKDLTAAETVKSSE